MITLPAIMLLLSMWSPIPTKIEGRVLDETNEPLCGVMISISDGNRLYTDLDGNFTIKTRSKKDKLIKAEFISFKDTFYQLNKDEKTITIVMKSK